MNKRKSTDEAVGEASKKAKINDENELISRLQNFVNEHKLTQQNAWHNNFIDDFQRMTQSKNIDLQQSAKFLEVAGKIYSYRVNSLLEDVNRTNVSLKVKLPKNNDEKTKVIADKPRFIKKSETVVKNLAILNKVLDVNPPFNPCFRKVLENAGNRTKEMLTNQLLSKNGSLVVPSFNTNIWDSSDYQERIYDNGVAVALESAIHKEGYGIRTSLENYKISEDPLEKHLAIQTISLDSDDEEMMADEETTVDQRKTQDSGIDDCFPCEQDLNQSEAPDLTQYDSMIFDESENVQEKSMELPDNLSMMPTNEEGFSYSYRSMDMIKNFWAGPSYWTFHEPKDLENTSRRKNTSKFKPSNEVTFESLCQLDDTLENKTCLKRIRKFCSHLTFPSDYEIDPEIFDHFATARHVDMTSPATNNILHSTAIYDDDNNENLQLFNDTIEFDESNDNEEIELPQRQKEEEEEQQHSLVISSFPLQVRKRVMNMKLIKETCHSIVKSEACVNGSSVLFSEVASKSSKLLLELNENTSTAVIFQAILHLTSEGKVSISNKINMDFEVQSLT